MTTCAATGASMIGASSTATRRDVVEYMPRPCTRDAAACLEHLALAAARRAAVELVRLVRPPDSSPRIGGYPPHGVRTLDDLADAFVVIREDPEVFAACCGNARGRLARHKDHKAHKPEAVRRPS